MAELTSISSELIVGDYRPAPDIDGELAHLAYSAITGWPDERPVDPAMVRSLLRPAGMTATTLVLHRGPDGVLSGAVALRWPATLDAPGRLWGPIVHPDQARTGLGQSLLAAASAVMAAHPGVTFTTSEIPEARTAGWSLFDRAGWRQSQISTMLKRELPGTPVPAGAAEVRSTVQGEYVAPALAELFGACRPHTGPTWARDTFTRWSSDSRYRPGGLLLAGPLSGLLGVALVYAPSREEATAEWDEAPTPVGAAESLLSEVLISPRLAGAEIDTVLQSLVAASVSAAATLGGTVVRAVVSDPRLIEALQVVGFDVVDRVRHYSAASAPDLSSSDGQTATA